MRVRTRSLATVFVAAAVLSLVIGIGVFHTRERGRSSQNFTTKALGQEADRQVARTGGRIRIEDPEHPEIKSIIQIKKKLQYGSFLWRDNDVPSGQILVLVDLRTQLISVFRGGHEIGTAVILFGSQSKPTPSGRYFIIEKRAHHKSNLYDASMPYTLRLTEDGISIHGSDVRFGAATHGCIGVPIGFASLLFAQAEVGSEVIVRLPEA